MGSGGRRRTSVLAGAVAGAVLVSGTVLWATDSWPFRDSYCWGAWEQNSGPSFLGDGALGTSGSERKATESAPPSATRPQASCTLTVTSEVEDDDSDDPLHFEERITLEYGPVPAGAKERRTWIAQYFNGTTSPLPDGLDGLVSGDRAMLVLPGSCDAKDGRPSAVTIRSGSTGDGHLGKVAMPFTIGEAEDVGRMLIDAANAGMEKAGCAPDEPLRTTAPVVTVAEDESRARSPLCRIPGMTFDFGEGSHYEEQVGTVTEELQTCSVVEKTLQMPADPAAQYVMARRPRMVALFDGLPEGPGQGLLRTTCDGRPTVFYGHVETILKDRGRPDDRHVFDHFAQSVSRRLGCESGEGA